MMGKMAKEPVNKFYCLEKDKADCIKNMVGEPECEFCQHYLVCTKCGHYDTTYCDGCMIAALNQSFDMSD
jgi:hypothetical protein